jgi:hypothetical protein
MQRRPIFLANVPASLSQTWPGSGNPGEKRLCLQIGRPCIESTYIRLIRHARLAWPAGMRSARGKPDGLRQQAGGCRMSDAKKQSPQAQDIFDAISEIWRKGNASSLEIEKNGKSVLNISLTVGTIGLLLAPVASLIGIGAALITEYTIKITLDNGTVIDVNEFVMTRKTTTGPKDSQSEDK